MTSIHFWERLQSFIIWFKRWLKKNWQLLILLLAGVYLPLLIFILLAVEIWQHQGGLTWDVAILMAIHATSQKSLDLFAATFTQLGTRWGVIPATAILSLALLYLKRWRSLTYFLITMIGCGFINITAKALLHRVRPSLWEYPALSDFSFPSGHAMASMTFVAALVILTWGSRWCLRMLLFGGIFVVIIAWTRLYLGVHYPSDILAGWMIAIAWAISVNLLVRPRLTKPVEREKELQNDLLVKHD